MTENAKEDKVTRRRRAGIRPKQLEYKIDGESETTAEPIQTETRKKNGASDGLGGNVTASRKLTAQGPVTC